MAETEAGPSTRDSILDAARRLFAERGYAGASLADIAGEVGIAKPSLLHHFANKDELYREVFDHLLAGWMTRADEAVQDTPGGWPQVEHVIISAFDFFAENPDAVKLVRREALEGNHVGVELASALKPLMERASGFFQREMDAGTFRKMDPDQLIITGLGAAMSYFSDVPLLSGLLDDDLLSDEAVARRREHLVDFFRAALEP